MKESEKAWSENYVHVMEYNDLFSTNLEVFKMKDCVHYRSINELHLKLQKQSFLNWKFFFWNIREFLWNLLFFSNTFAFQKNWKKTVKW